MRISDVLRRKGDDVVTIRRDATVAELLDLLTEHRIGAVVVSDGEGRVDGIVSERDVVLHLRRAAAPPLEEKVGAIMTTEVTTCTPEDDIESLARTMTERRVRHLPVVVDGRLAGIVSIGDIVKQRLDELQDERDQLVDYVQQGRPAPH
ncbi:CBS domain-containing protein [Georgenia sp. EYE_87]|uniref:CBS domain-containing protein n=1 Tax=Georgenia sp. EYE_87 TaxID=2853448 RepID=UPI00200653E3|nr:CBS domain-containing protein [Georgenia sp. EYE_87]MCK6212585.1 CBS domain-containing protein [Georgenia sp. EYE_87]